jgi:hypothetical protein
MSIFQISMQLRVVIGHTYNFGFFNFSKNYVIYSFIFFFLVLISSFGFYLIPEVFEPLLIKPPINENTNLLQNTPELNLNQPN